MTKSYQNGFEQVSIGEFCETGSGGTPSRQKAAEYFGGTIPWVKSGELRENIITSTEESITDIGLKESSAKLLPRNTLLVALYGATVGRIGVLGIEAATNQAVCYIIPDERRVNRQYLFYALRVQVPFWLSKRVGGGQPNISQGIIKQTKIPLPPLPEQRRIADILDKADAIRRKRQEAIKELESLCVATYFDWFGNPASSQNSITLGECVTFVSGGTPSKQNSSYWDGEFPWVSPKDMKVDYIIDSADHITDLVFKETSLKKIPAQSILIVIRGMILAHTVPIAVLDVPVAINQDMKALIPKSDYNTEFLSWTLKAAHNYILSKVSTAAHGTKRLEVEHLVNLLIPNITREQQERFAKYVKKIRVSLNQSRTFDSDYLFNSLVQRAFRGEL